MLRSPCDVARGAAIAAFSLLLLAACADSRRSAAAEVSGEDVRRLPPERKLLAPDVIMQHADRSRVLGRDSATAQLFVVSDFQCPSCRVWFDSVLPAVRAEYADPGTLRLTLVHYPLRGHPNAVLAASAALCAGAQDQFWPASARLFAGMERWARASDAEARVLLDSLVTVPGVDPLAVRACTKGRRMLRQIRADIDWVDAEGYGTPPLVVIGRRRLSGSAPLAAIRAVIDSVLAGK